VTGDGRNSLLQPGAEKLCFAFQFAPSFESERTDIPPEDVPNAEEPVQGHREYEVECKLHHRPSGQYIGSGRGSCSTLESKYRYRKDEEITDVEPPQAFWDSYDKGNGENMGDADFSILRGHLNKKRDAPVPADADMGVEFVDNTPLITYETGRKENPDIADQYNTVLKMAEKRALVNAVKRCTAASDIFTQDTEDLAVRSGSNVQRDTSAQPNTQQSQPQKRVERYGYALTPGQAEKLEKRDEALGAYDGEALRSAIESVEDEMQDWPIEHLCNACDTMLDSHRERLQEVSATDGGSDRQPAQSPSQAHDPSPEEPQEARYDGPQDALQSNFDEAWQSDSRAWVSISEGQLKRMYAIAEENGWDEAALNRLVKDELGYESKSDVPYGDPYDEICEALEDERLRYHMSRDPDTKDLFEGDGDAGGDDDPFEGAEDELPF